MQDMLEDERTATSRMAEGRRACTLLVNRLCPAITALAARLLDANGVLEGDLIELLLASELPVETRVAIASSYESSIRLPYGA